MKVVFLVFSPSGHTLLTAQNFMNMLENKGVSCDMINITKNDNYIQKEDITHTLYSDIGEHCMLVVCAPIYAGHCEQNMLRIIHMLPKRKNGRIPAILLVTYGGVHSSVALEEMGKGIRSRGYIPIMGIKIAAEHTLTATFKKRINRQLPGEKEQQVLAEAAEIAVNVLNGKTDPVDAKKALEYAPFPKRLMFRILSQEKIHGKYKKVAINSQICNGCGQCIRACPVNMFAYVDNKVQLIRNPGHCILCAECYHHCTAGAIIHPYIEVARKRLSDGFAELENPQSAVYH